MGIYSLKHKHNRKVFMDGLRDGVPIALGYFAVSFSLGVAAKMAGLSAFQGLLASFLCNASAGEYAAFTLIAANASYLEMAFATLITNARYLLMSCALSQKAESKLSIGHRLAVAFDITDEVFGISIAREGKLNPCYTYGAMCTTIPSWALGTAAGIIAGNILSARIVSALSVALFGMFLAIIIPPAKKDKIIACLVVISFVLSFAAGYIPVISSISSGTRTIILTVLISAAAALFFPRKEETEAEDGT